MEFGQERGMTAFEHPEQIGMSTQQGADKAKPIEGRSACPPQISAHLL